MLHNGNISLAGGRPNRRRHRKLGAAWEDKGAAWEDHVGGLDGGAALEDDDSTLGGPRERGLVWEGDGLAAAWEGGAGREGDAAWEVDAVCEGDATWEDGAPREGGVAWEGDAAWEVDAGWEGLAAHSALWEVGAAWEDDDGPLRGRRDRGPVWEGDGVAARWEGDGAAPGEMGLGVLSFVRC